MILLVDKTNRIDIFAVQRQWFLLYKLIVSKL